MSDFGASATQTEPSQVEPIVSTLRASVSCVVERMKASEIVTMGDNTPDDLRAAIESYFHIFASPQKNEAGKTVCLKCREPFDGFLSAFGAAVAHEWGMAHGEARCTSCGWPSRGMHYIKDAKGDEIATLRNVFLQYHPDEVTERDAA